MLIAVLAIVTIGSTVVIENSTETLFENALRQDAAATAHAGRPQ
jgi:hypothetical protein